MRKCNIFLFAILIIALSFQGYVAYENFRDKRKRRGRGRGKGRPEPQHKQPRPSGRDSQEIKMRLPTSVIKTAQELAGPSMRSIQQFHDQLHK